jgi:hypothetical protein
MNRRRLAVVVALLTVTASIPFTGAFTSTTADRTVSVSVAGDESAALGLEPSGAPDGAYARIEGGQLELVFDGSTTGVTGQGLNPSATTRFGDVFNVTNRGTQPVGVVVEDGSSHVAFFADGTRLDDGGGVTLDPGEHTQVDVEFEAGRDASLESLSNVTIRASAALAGGGGGGPSVPSTPGSVQTRRSGDSVVASGTVEAGDSVTFGLSDLPTEGEGNVTVESMRIDYAESTAVNTTVTTRTDPGDVPTPPNGTALRYLNVSHPEASDAAIEGATVRFVVPRGDGPRNAVDLLRYDPVEGWETASTEVALVGNTTDGRIYEARTDDLSVLAAVEIARSLIVTTPAVERPVNATLIGGNSSYPTDSYRIYRTEALNASWWDERATRNADDAAAVIREKLRIDLRQTAKDAVLSKLVAYADAALQSVLHISGISTVLTALSVALDSGEFLGSYGPAIQQKAVAIHVDPGTGSYDQLRRNLRQLEENTRAFKAAARRGDAEAKRELLVERERLLSETYELLPRYLNDVHGDVVGNAAGMEDPRSYVAIRSNVESLRMQLISDYRVTTTRLDGAPDRRLQRETSMPTHGWVAFGNANVYDTMDHGDDYVVLRLNATRAVAAGESVQVTVEGANVSRMETVVVDRRPDDPRDVTGREITGVGTSASTELSAPAETMYVVVRANGASGPISVRAGSSERVSFDVAERAGPDIQRPHADLVTGPDPVTLRDGDVVYPTNETDTDLVWELWDDKTATGDLEYRLRVDRGSGFTGWTAWRTAPTDGRVSPDIAYGRGLTRVQLQVRDGVGRTTVRNADVVVTDGVPQTAVADTNDPESGTVFVRVLPEIRIERVELQYRRAGNETWTDWKTVNDTAGFGDDLSVPVTGEVEVRARATGLDGRTGEWGSETVTYRPPDTTPPTASLEQKPPIRAIPIDGERRERRVPAGDEATLRWNVSDDETANASVDYRLRVDGTWSDWAPTGDGTVETDVSLDGGGTTVELAVRDDAGNVATRTVDLARDTAAPSIDIDSQPPVGSVVIDGERQKRRVTAAESATLRWDVDDIATADGSVDYRLRIDGTWTDWTPTGDGTVETDVSLDDGPATVELAARDDAGNVATRTVRLARDTEAPTVEVAASPDVLGTIVNTTADEPVRSIDLQYRPTDADDWRRLEELSGTGTDAVDVDRIGRIEVRARGTDRAGNVGPWSEPVETASLRPEQSVSVDDGSRRLGGGEGTEYDFGDAAEDARDGYVAYNAFVDEIDGELLIDTYVVTRQGREIPIGSITLTEERNQTVRADLPGNLTQGDRLKVEVDGNGTAVIGDVRAIGARPSVPRVNASPANASVGERVRLSIDPSWPGSGYVTAYEWDLDGDDDYERTTDGPNTTVEYDSPGARAVTLRVTDVFNATGTNGTTVRVNAPPTAAIGGETTVRTREEVRLNATPSADADGEVVTAEWDLDADGDYERTGGTIRPTFDDEGERSITLRVTDDDGATDTRTRTLTVRNRAPEAAASVRDATPTVGQSVEFDAADSADPDGVVANVAWDFDADGDYERVGPDPTATFDRPGERTVGVRVADDDGATDVTTVDVDVNAPPEPALSVPESVPTGEAATLDGSDSVDPDGEIVDYELAIVGTGVDNGVATWTRSFADDGTYPIRLTVTDDQGATATVTRNLTVRNRAPNATASVESATQTVGEPIELDATGSTDPDGTVAEVAWDLDADGEFERTGANPTVTYDLPGELQIVGRVTDDDGATDTTRVDVDVDAPPTAAIGGERTVRTGEEIRLNATASEDIDGRVTTAEWDLDADGDYERTGETITPVFGDDGERPVTLRVTDDDGLTDTRTRTLTVRNRAPELSVTGPFPRDVTENETARFEVNATDPDGTIRSTTVGIVSPTNESRTTTPRRDGTVDIVFDRSGEWTITVVAVDGDGNRTTVERTVSVDDRPTAAIVVDGDPTVNESLTLSANATDADGTIRNYTWFVGSERLTGETVTVTPTEEGPLTVELEVVDDDGARTTVERTVSVDDGPAPVIFVEGDPTVNESLTLSAGTQDDGTIRNYTWFVGSERLTGETVTVTPTEEGPLTVELEVVDDDGDEGSAVRTVQVASGFEVNVSAGTALGGRVISAFARTPVESGQEVEDEHDGDTTFAWDLDGDGTYETAGEPARDRLVSAPGTYEIGVRATNPNGTTAVDRTTVTVEELNLTGSLAWNTNTTGPLSVVLGSERAYVIVDGDESDTAEDGDEIVTAFDRDTGSVVWRTELPIGGFELHHTDDTLTVSGEGAAELDPETGDVRWSVATDDYARVTETDETTYVLASETLTAVDRPTGDVEWTRQLAGDVYEPPAAGDGVVAYLVQRRDDGTIETPLVVRDADSGERLWTFERDTGLIEIAGVVDGTVITADGGTLVGRDATNGTELWSQQMPSESVDYAYVRDLAIENGTVYASVSDYPSNYVVAVGTDGERLWTRRTVETPEFAVADDTVYTAGEGRITALNGTDGTARWETFTADERPRDLEITGDRVVVRAGAVYALDRATGDVTWRDDPTTTGRSGRYAADDGTVLVRTVGGVYVVEVDETA